MSKDLGEYSMSCPRCGVDDIVVHLLSYTPAYPASYWHPGEAEEIEWEVSAQCPECKLTDDEANDQYIDQINDTLREKYADRLQGLEDAYWEDKYEARQERLRGG